MRPQVQVVCCAKTPYSESCPLHWDMLCSSYLAFTGGALTHTCMQGYATRAMPYLHARTRGRARCSGRVHLACMAIRVKVRGLTAVTY